MEILYFIHLYEDILNTTYVVGYKEIAEQINTQICNTLPIENEKY
ncbi:5975_t:CDS:2 [Funneliformis mosseae]|uniref:5975_t:CDS:1 n=1 Tax=Funneliformis mosseae TaxID=27381 RepID=A0A9N8ZWR4_FUNMO|nr:5975_t:CDS:2 [Funneliformis mosseae]